MLLINIYGEINPNKNATFTKKGNPKGPTTPGLEINQENKKMPGSGYKYRKSAAFAID